MTEPSGKIKTIAYICPNLIGDYYQTQWMALYHWASLSNISAMLFSPYLHYIRPELANRYRRNFHLAHAAKVDGVVINDASLSVFFSPAEIAQLVAGFGNIPLITLSGSYANFPAVLADNSAGFRALMEHLLVDHSYRRLAFIQGIEGNSEAIARHQVFCESLQKYGIVPDQSLIMPGNFVFDSGEKAAKTLCDHPDGLPQVIVCANDEMALGAITGLKQRGYQVPKDVAITGYDDTEAASRYKPALTTVTQQVVNQVGVAVNRLTNAMNQNAQTIDDGQIIQFLPTSPTVRNSCGCTTNNTSLILSPDNLFLQQNQHLISNRGCEIGEVANFSKKIMAQLSFESLGLELDFLSRLLHLETLIVIMYSPDLDARASNIPHMSHVLYDLNHTYDPHTPSNLNTLEIIEEYQKKSPHRQTLVVSEMFFNQNFYGYVIIGREEPDPLVFQMTILEITNCLYTIFLKNRMDAANQKLRAFDSLKNDFIANITHDFRSPLSIVLGTSELALLNLPPGDQNAESFQVIREASYKLKDIIDRFLDLSRMDERGVVLRIQNIDLVGTLTSFADFYRSSLLKSSISFELELPPAVPTNIWTDPEKLDQILSNLVSNALKFINRETGKLWLKLEEHDEQIIIKIKDNGIGIPIDKLESIFERFTQLGDIRSQRLRGTGIGLAFSRALAIHLKGSLIAHSDGPGCGATFTLTLPKGKAHFSEGDLMIGEGITQELPYNRQKVQEQALIQVQESLPHPLELQLAPTGSPMHDFSDIRQAVILIIEDYPAILKLERDFLAQAGYQYFILANNGTQGLDAARKYHPDIIICDVNMPGISGDQLYNTLAEDEAFKRTPFIFVSAVTDRDFINQIRNRGAEAFLTKPIDANELTLTVNSHLRSSFERRREIFQAQLDELTGLSNRASLMHQIQSLFLCRQYRDFSFVFLDVDHFKQINDTYGHQRGDHVLHAVAQELLHNLRPYDIIGRYGGEEFLILLPDTNLLSAQTVAEKLRRRIEGLRIGSGDFQQTVTVSLGVSSLIDQIHLLTPPLSAIDWPAVFRPNPSTVQDWHQWKREIIGAILELIKRADQGMYLAKNRGRNQVGLFEGPLK